MNHYPKLIRILSFFPVFYILNLATIGLIGIVYFGELPVYGRHADPSSLHIDWLNGLGLLLFLASWFAIPFFVFFVIDELANKRRLSRSVLVSLTLVLLSITLFLLIKYCYPSFFAWIMD